MTVRDLYKNMSSLIESFPEVLDYAVVADRDGIVNEVLWYPHIGKWNPETGYFKSGTDKANALLIA